MIMTCKTTAQNVQFLKYHNVEKWKSRFTLGLDAAENTHRIKKRFI